MSLKNAYVYILSNKNRTVFYVGVTNDLERRIREHKQRLSPGFTKKYNVYDLMWYEVHHVFRHAIAREKQFKEWKREWKLELIKTMNPDMLDLAADWA